METIQLKSWTTTSCFLMSEIAERIIAVSAVDTAVTLAGKITNVANLASKIDLEEL